MNSSTRFLTSVVVSTLVFTVSAQRQHMDRLDRGLVAVKTNAGVYCSWRIQADEYYDVQYNLYRDGAKVNAQPLETSNFTDPAGTASAHYTVRAVVRGVEQADSKAVNVWATNYLEIVPKHDASLTSTYVPNDACCADVDGDGEVEILLKYDNQSEINASYPKNGNNGEYSLFECLKLDGTVLWWVNCGPNMGDFQNNEQNIVAYDWDGDGRAEAIFRAADGTTIHMADGTTYVVGDASINYRAATGGGTNWFMHSGAEFLLYVDGQTGKPYQCMDYPLPRLEESENPQHLLSGSAYDNLVNSAWGDGYGHRSSKHFFGAPYLDGIKPSIFLGRGIYTQHKFVTFDVDPATHELKERWRWSNKNPGPWYGQGYHNYTIADVDWDGRDEIVWGSMVIDDNGFGLSTTGFGHGDAQHVGDLNPYVHGQEGFFCNEDEPANNYRDLTTSKVYYRLVDTNDAGRAMAGNFTDDFPGSIGWSAHDTPISLVTNGHVDGMQSTGLTQNFRIYWDGDLCEECVDAGIYKYGQAGAIFSFPGSTTNNSTKATPCQQGDIFGDWREEVIRRTSDNKIRIYTTTFETKWRNYSLWYDHQYRNAMVWQMCGYNQPPHTSYFLGEAEGITVAPPPLTTQGRSVVSDNGVIGSALNDKHILVAEYSDATVRVESGASPYITTFYVPSWVQGTAESGSVEKEADIRYQYYSLQVTGEAFTGLMRLVKQGDGNLYLPNVVQTYTGETNIWAGKLYFDGTLQHSPLWLNRFAALHTTGGSFAGGIKADYGSLIEPKGEVSVSSLMLGFGSEVHFDLDGKNVITAESITLEKKEWQFGPEYVAPVFTFSGEALEAGTYKLIQTASVNGSLDDVILKGIRGKKCHLEFVDGAICLVIADLRPAEDVVWTGSMGSIWDLDNTANFSSSTGTFVSGDHLVFDDNAQNFTVNVAEDVMPGSMTFKADAHDYIVEGDGNISGTGTLSLEGQGAVFVRNTNTYTGETYVNHGVLIPTMLANKDGVAYGSLGGVDNNIVLNNKAILRVDNPMTTSQPIVLAAAGGTIDVTNGSLIVNGSIAKQYSAGKGNLYKTGKGTLQLDCTSSFDTLFIDGGTVYDFGDNHFNGKTIVIGDATLQYSNSIYSTNSDNVKFVVPEGKTATIFPDGRCDYTGTLSGGGTLNLHANWVRLYFNGNWSAFTGVINAYQDGKVSNYDPSFEFNNSYGLGKATLNIQTGCTVHTNGKNFAIGELVGSGKIDNGGAKSSSVNTLTIGGKNTDFSYAGQIINSKVSKVGEGRWTVSNVNTLASAGTVNINAGSIYLNSTASGSLLGNNLVTVNTGGALLGKGVVTSLYLSEGAVYRPGTGSSDDTQSGTIKVLGSFQAMPGSHIYLNKTTKTNTASSRSYIECQGKLTLNGTIHLTYRSGYKPAAGDSATLFIAEQIVGNPTFDLQELPEGLEWDTSTLLQDGVIRITAAAGIQQVLTDDGVLTCQVYDIAGNLVSTFGAENVNDIPALLRKEDLKTSVYIVRMTSDSKVQVKRFILK